MHPAYSIIFFTTASGAGYGLLALLGLLWALGLMPADRGFGAAGLVPAVLLISAGLLSSLWHLGHPERAWRALSQWRSSWLSREGVMALLTFLPALGVALGWIGFERNDGPWSALGVLAAVAAALTVYCTAMIYRSVAAVPQWHQPLVPVVYLGLALATGAVWLNGILALFGYVDTWVGWLCIVAIAVAWAAKQRYWRAIDDDRPASTVESATGLGHLGPVRLLESPHTQDNYLLSEMGYRVARKHARKLRRIAMALSFIAPLVLIALQPALPGYLLPLLAALLAVAAVSAGVIVERWLFFAEARHKVMLYYGAGAV